MEKTTLNTIPLMFNHRFTISLTEPQTLRLKLESYLLKCRFQILNFVEHHFKPYGYTCLWLLGESHLAVHTFPEKGQAYLELSGCNQEKTEQFTELIEKWAAENDYRLEEI